MGQGGYIFGCRGPRLDAGEKAFFADADPWGFVLFARNVENPDQLRALTSELRDCVGRQAPILIDQEGGRVERMGAPHWRQWMPPADQVAIAGGNAARSMALRYRLIGEELRAVGIDCNCAPVADIARKDTHPVLANRCYGAGAVQVTAMARAVADCLADAGILPVLKHIPGHGRATHDSHLGLPVVRASEKELFATDFAPFAALNDLTMAMTAHIVYNALDDIVATISSKMIAIIRSDIGFQGLLMTDDISMQALAGPVAGRASRALAAGCDVVLHCNGDLREMQEIATSCGKMPAPAQARADTVLAARPKARPIDIAATEAELTSLLGGSPYV